MSTTPGASVAGSTIAAVDLGTNSFHLVVARVLDATGRFEVVAREKEMVRLGTGATDMSRLDDEAIDRGIAALRRCRSIAEVHGAELVAVATSAVREADNAQVFLDRARSEAGVDVDVITGLEEARLIYLGVLRSVPAYDRRLVLIDIGGGSTEVLVGERAQTLAVGSFKLGAIRLTNRFFRTDRLHPGALDACRRHVRSELAPMGRHVRRLAPELAVGSSGTIEAVAALAHARSGLGTPRTFANHPLSRGEVRRVVDELSSCETVAERAELPGMDPRRADIVLAGAVILEQALGELGIDELVVSDFALREGLLADLVGRKLGAARHHLHDLRRDSVLHLADRLDPERAHADHVARLALALFDETARLGLHWLGDEERELLEAAALLANLGMSVAHSAHHKHSYYLIRNTDQLLGFTDHEIELIACVARYHRKAEPSPEHEEFRALRPPDQQRVRVMAGLLRVAIGLDRSHVGAVRGVHARLEAGDPRVLHLALEPAVSTDLALEVYAARERTGLLARALEVRIELGVATSGPDRSDERAGDG